MASSSLVGGARAWCAGCTLPTLAFERPRRGVGPTAAGRPKLLRCNMGKFGRKRRVRARELMLFQRSFRDEYARNSNAELITIFRAPALFGGAFRTLQREDRRRASTCFDRLQRAKEPPEMGQLHARLQSPPGDAKIAQTTPLPEQ